MRPLRGLTTLPAEAAGVLVFAAPATASGDYSCSAEWKLVSAARSCAGRIVLAPGNDSRHG